MKLNVDEERSIQFDVAITGANPSELIGRLVIEANNIEYGFSASILADHISVQIPSLLNIINEIKNDDVLVCKLEVLGEGFYTKAWEGNFEAVVPANVKTKNIKVTTFKESDDIKPIRENNSVTKVHVGNDVILKETEKDKFIQYLMKKLKEQKSHYLSIIKESKNVKSVSKKSTPKNRPFMSHVSEADMVTRKLGNILTKKKIVTGLVEDKKSVSQSNPAVITLESCKTLMSKMGMTSKKTQENMLEKAEQLGGSDPSAMYSTLEKLLGVSHEKNTMEMMYEKTMNLKR